MSTTTKSSEKINICLSDYDVKRDIHNRLMLRSLNSDEVFLLREIINNSLEFPIESLSKEIDVCMDLLYKKLLFMANLGLFEIKNKKIYVNKENRRYLEVHISHLQPHFSPDLEYFYQLLRLLPMEVLLTWYPPRSSNDIFQSIREKYLSDPDIYQKYLSEYLANETIAAKIARDVFHSPHLRMPMKKIKSHYQLTDQECEKIVLELEFHIICFLGKEENEEIIMPLKEWQQYQLFLYKQLSCSRHLSSYPLSSTCVPYAFIKGIDAMLSQMPINLLYHKEEETWKTTEEMNSISIESSTTISSHFINRLIHKLITLKLCVVKNSQLQPNPEEIKKWTRSSLLQKILFLFQSKEHFSILQKDAPFITRRTFMSIEKKLSTFSPSCWIGIAEFLSIISISYIPEKQVFLKKQGKEWQYAFPTFLEKEKCALRHFILEWLCDCGITNIGENNKEEIFFQLTPYGKDVLT